MINRRIKPTDKQLETIQELAAKSVPVPRIAKAVGHSKNWVYSIIQDLGITYVSRHAAKGRRMPKQDKKPIEPQKQKLFSVSSMGNWLI